MTEKSYDRIVAFILENKDNFYRLAYLNIDNRELALDLVGNSVGHALDWCNTLHDNMAVDIWFYRILVDECRNMERNTKKITDIDRAEDEIKESEDNILQRIKKLDFEHRTVFILCYFEDFVQGEIAQIMRMEPREVDLCLLELPQIL